MLTLRRSSHLIYRRSSHRHSDNPATPNRPPIRTSEIVHPAARLLGFYFTPSPTPSYLPLSPPPHKDVTIYPRLHNLALHRQELLEDRLYAEKPASHAESGGVLEGMELVTDRAAKRL